MDRKADWRLALARKQLYLRRKLEGVMGWRSPVEMQGFTGFYKALWQRAAAAIGASFEELAEGFWEVRRDGRMTLINNFEVRLDDPVILHLAGDKALCYRLLQRGGLPVPEHAVYSLAEFETAAQFIRAQGPQLAVVKPSKGTSGARGVTTHIRTLPECRKATALASLYGEAILIERWIAGESYRLLVLDGRMIHASRRRGLRVVGDGTATIDRLMARQIRAAGVSAADRDIVATLAAQGLTTASVLEDRREVLVRSSPLARHDVGEQRTVFDENVTGEICGAIRAVAAQAAELLFSRFAGVDVITLDPTLPLIKTGGVINEINTTPGLHHHYNLINQTGVDPASEVLVYLLSDSSRLTSPGCSTARHE
ncbi:MAG: hypothetical protein ACREWG_14215 [Gammaproteobacteria bacterium]